MPRNTRRACSSGTRACNRRLRGWRRRRQQRPSSRARRSRRLLRQHCCRLGSPHCSSPRYHRRRYRRSMSRCYRNRRRWTLLQRCCSRRRRYCPRRWLQRSRRPHRSFSQLRCCKQRARERWHSTSAPSDTTNARTSWRDLMRRGLGSRAVGDVALLLLTGRALRRLAVTITRSAPNVAGKWGVRSSVASIANSVSHLGRKFLCLLSSSA